MKSLGLKVLRFDNIQVLKETDAVLQMIYDEVAKTNPPLVPLCKRGKLRKNSHPYDYGVGRTVQFKFNLFY